MDISMPHMNGVDAVKAIVSKYQSAIIIMITAIGQEQMVIDAIDAGAKGYLLKPVKEESLLRTVSAVYDKYGKNF